MTSNLSFALSNCAPEIGDHVLALTRKGKDVPSAFSCDLHVKGEYFPFSPHVSGRPKLAFSDQERGELFNLDLFCFVDVFGAEDHLALPLYVPPCEQSLLVSQKNESGTGNFSLGYPQGHRANGGGSDLLEAEELATEKAKKPPTRWVNWWVAPSGGYRCIECGVNLPARIPVRDCCGAVHPSRDWARTVAADEIAAVMAAGMRPAKYLDAWPDGETPP